MRPRAALQHAGLEHLRIRFLDAIFPMRVHAILLYPTLTDDEPSVSHSYSECPDVVCGCV